MSGLTANVVKVNNLTVSGTTAGSVQANNFKFQNLDVNGNLSVGGNISLNNQLSVTGSVNVTRGVTIDGPLNALAIRDLQEQGQYTEDMAHINRVRLNHEETQDAIFEDGKTFDYIICGSGSGGGMAAYTLANELNWFDKEVLVIEQGAYRSANMYHEYPAVNSANKYYGHHNIEQLLPNSIEDQPGELFAFERNVRWDGTWIPGRKSLWSPHVFGGGSTINGGLLNSVPDFKLETTMPTVNISLFRQCGTWIHERLGHQTNSYKFNVFRTALSDFYTTFYGSSIKQAYERDAAGNYTTEAKQYQVDYNIETFDLEKENYVGYSFPRTGGFRSVAKITAVTSAIYRKRHGVAYLLETFQGKSLNLLVKHRVDRIIWDPESLPGSPVDVSGNTQLAMTATGIEVTDLSRKSDALGPRPKTFPILLRPGGEVFLAGNVYGTPLIAMRSGYGPRVELEKLAAAGSERFKPVAYNELVGEKFISPAISRELNNGVPICGYSIMNFNRDLNGVSFTQSPFSDEFQEVPNNGDIDMGVLFYSNDLHPFRSRYINGDQLVDVSFNAPMSYMIQTYINGMFTTPDFGSTDTTTSFDYNVDFKYLDPPGTTTDANAFLKFSSDSFYKNKKRGEIVKSKFPSQDFNFAGRGIAVGGVANVETNSLKMGGYVRLSDSSGDLYTPKASLEWFTEKDNLLAIKEANLHSYNSWFNNHPTDITKVTPMVVPANTTDFWEAIFCNALKGFMRYVYKNAWRIYAKPPLIDPSTQKPYLTPSGVFVPYEMTWEELYADEPTWLNAYDTSGHVLTYGDVKNKSGFVKYNVGVNVTQFYTTTDGSVDYAFDGTKVTVTEVPAYYKYEGTASDIYCTSTVKDKNNIVYRVIKTDADGYQYIDSSPADSDVVQTQFGWKRNKDNSIMYSGSTPLRLIHNSHFDDYVMYQTLDSIHFSGSMSEAVDTATFKLKGVTNVRCADSSIIAFPQLANSQGMCMQMGRYIALLAIGDITPDLPLPDLTGMTTLFGPSGTDSDLSTNFTVRGGGLVNGLIRKHTFSVAGSTGNKYITSPCVTNVPSNTYLCTVDNDYDDFVISLDIKAVRANSSISGENKLYGVNGGVQFRSYEINDDVKGLQVEFIDQPEGSYYVENTGIYFEGDGGVRGFLTRSMNGNKSTSKFLPNDWNTYVIKVVGNRHQIWLNGTLCTDFSEKQENYDLGYDLTTGFIGLQQLAVVSSSPYYWNGPGCSINFRNIKVKRL